MRPEEHQSVGEFWKDARTFWMVWSPQGATPSRVRHPSREAAQVAAEAMARQCRGSEFFVVQAVSLSVVDGVKTTMLEG